METLYRKVAASKEPKHNGNYHCIFPEGQIFTIPFLKEYGFHDEFTDCSGITHYLEEIPDTIAQLKADKAELLEALDNSLKVIEWYMENTMPENENHTDFFNIGMNQRTEIESLIQKHKQCQENKPR